MGEAGQGRRPLQNKGATMALRGGLGAGVCPASRGQGLAVTMVTFSEEEAALFLGRVREFASPPSNWPMLSAPAGPVFVCWRKTGGTGV